MNSKKIRKGSKLGLALKLIVDRRQRTTKEQTAAIEKQEWSRVVQLGNIELGLMIAEDIIRSV